MRLPINGNNQAEINEPEAIRLIRYAIDQGVNYIDTAFPYHEGNSEAVVGKALAGTYRQKVKIATKMPIFSIQTKNDLDRIFELQFKRLKTGHIDLYLLHALMKQTWSKVEELAVLDWAERQIKKGKIGQIGFSFHDELDVFREIVDAYDWAFCQIQYNYLDEHYQAGVEGLRYAAARGLAVVVMEPLAGGLLAVPPPPNIQRELDKSGVKRTPADWGLQWVWSHPEVVTALSGMNSMTQLQDNLESANNSAVNSLTQKEIQALAKSRELFQQFGYIGCSKCRYCSKCPQHIDIPQTLTFLNEFATKRRDLSAQAQIKREYTAVVPTERRANNCIRCGQCESICPQHLPVRRLLSETAACLQ